MKPLLSDEEVASMLVVHHTEPMSRGTDSACDAEVQQLCRALQGLPELVQERASRPDHFWHQQRAMVWKRMEGSAISQPRRVPKLAWLAATATFAIAAILLSTAPVPPPPQAAHVDPDHELLLEIERALDNGGPQALEPASLLVREISQNTQSNSPSAVDTKEKLQ